MLNLANLENFSCTCTDRLPITLRPILKVKTPINCFSQIGSMTTDSTVVNLHIITEKKVNSLIVCISGLTPWVGGSVYKKIIIILIIQEVGIKKNKNKRVKLDSRTFIDIRYIDFVNSVAEVYCPIAKY